MKRINGSKKVTVTVSRKKFRNRGLKELKIKKVLPKWQDVKAEIINRRQA